MRLCSRVTRTFHFLSWKRPRSSLATSQWFHDLSSEGTQFSAKLISTKLICSRRRYGKVTFLLEVLLWVSFVVLDPRLLLVPFIDVQSTWLGSQPDLRQWSSSSRCQTCHAYLLLYWTSWLLKRLEVEIHDPIIELATLGTATSLVLTRQLLLSLLCLCLIQGSLPLDLTLLRGPTSSQDLLPFPFLKNSLGFLCDDPLRSLDEKEHVRVVGSCYSSR